MREPRACSQPRARDSGVDAAARLPDVERRGPGVRVGASSGTWTEIQSQTQACRRVGLYENLGFVQREGGSERERVGGIDDEPLDRARAAQEDLDGAVGRVAD